MSLELGVSTSILLSVVSTLILLCKLGSQGKGLCSSAGLRRLGPFFCEVIVLTTGAVGPDWVGAPARLLPHKGGLFLADVFSKLYLCIFTVFTVQC